MGMVMSDSNAGKECMRKALVMPKLCVKSTVEWDFKIIFFGPRYVLFNCSKHLRVYFQFKYEKASSFKVMQAYNNVSSCSVSELFSQVFAGLFPSDQSEFVGLRSAVERLTLNDSSVSIHPDSRSVPLKPKYSCLSGWHIAFLIFVITMLFS